MPVITFDWDEENIRHIDYHDVVPEEVEDAFADPDRIPATAHRGPGDSHGAPSLVQRTKGVC
jgi:hypothetical protein